MKQEHIFFSSCYKLISNKHSFNKKRKKHLEGWKDDKDDDGVDNASGARYIYTHSLTQKIITCHINNYYFETKKKQKPKPKYNPIYIYIYTVDK